MKYNYEEELIDQIYEPENTKIHISISMSTALFFNTNALVPNSGSNVEEDTRSNQEFIFNLNVEFQEKVLLKIKEVYKRSWRVGIARGTTKSQWRLFQMWENRTLSKRLL